MVKAKSKAASAKRDSIGKHLGIKLASGQEIKAGQIIIRQRGTKFIAGKNVKKGRDDTLFATIPGILQFKSSKRTKFDKSRKIVRIANVIPKK